MSKSISAAHARRKSAKTRAHGGATPRQLGDFGAPLAVERGGVEIRTNALIPDDPQSRDSPQRNGARAQRVWAPERLTTGRNPIVDASMLAAAERFLHDYLIAEHGARPGLDISGVRSAAWARTGYSHTRAEARQEFVNAKAAIGPRSWSIVRWCVLQEPSPPIAPATVEAWASSQLPKRWSVDRAVGFLAAILETLVAHYDRRRGGPR